MEIHPSKKTAPAPSAPLLERAVERVLLSNPVLRETTSPEVVCSLSSLVADSFRTKLTDPSARSLVLACLPASSITCAKDAKLLLALIERFKSEMPPDGWTRASQVIVGQQKFLHELSFPALSGVLSRVLATAARPTLSPLFDIPQLLDGQSHALSLFERGASLFPVAIQFIGNSKAEEFARRIKIALCFGEGLSPYELYTITLSLFGVEVNATRDGVALPVDAKGKSPLVSIIRRARGISKAITQIEMSLQCNCWSTEADAVRMRGILCALCEPKHDAIPLMHEYVGRPEGETFRYLLAALECGVEPDGVKRLVMLAESLKLPLSDFSFGLARFSSADLSELTVYSRREMVCHRSGRKRPQVVFRPAEDTVFLLGVLKELDSIARLGELKERILLYDALQSKKLPWVTEVIAGAHFRLVYDKTGQLIGEADLNRYAFALDIYAALSRGQGIVPDPGLYAWQLSALPEIGLRIAESLSGENPKEDLILLLKAESERETALTQKLVQMISLLHRASQDTWREVFEAALILKEKKFPENRSKVFVETLLALEDPTHPGLFAATFTPTLREYEARLGRKHLLTYFFSRSSDARGESARWLASNSGYYADTGPYRTYERGSAHLTSDFKRMIAEVREVYRGTFELHYGFGQSTFDCRTLPDGTEWMFTRYAREIAHSVFRLGKVPGHNFPGAGLFLEGIRVERVFAKNAATREDPYSLFKAAWPWVAGEFDELEFLKVLVSRGVKAFIAPDTDKYHLDGVHYSLVVWNDHLENRLLDAAALVPTTILLPLVRLACTSLERTREEGQGGILSDALRLPDLVRAAEIGGLNVLNLGWPSNVGGLCNAYPAGSAPHFEWERGHGNWGRDRAGHVHKSHLPRHHQPRTARAKREQLEGIRQAHSDIYRLATAYYRLNDLFRITQSYWRKGLTAPLDSDAGLEVVTSESLEFDLGENETRMLREAFRWHGLHEMGVSDRFSFPVLVLGNTFDYWGTVRTPLVLDTFDLSLRLQGGPSIQFKGESRGTGAFEFGVWAKYVRPLYNRKVEVDPRFVDRRYVTDEPNNGTN